MGGRTGPRKAKVWGWYGIRKKWLPEVTKGYRRLQVSLPCCEFFTRRAVAERYSDFITGQNNLFNDAVDDAPLVSRFEAGPATVKVGGFRNHFTRG